VVVDAGGLGGAGDDPESLMAEALLYSPATGPGNGIALPSTSHGVGPHRPGA
jgi:hypothetical protein